jgi:hypothetical protein
MAYIIETVWLAQEEVQRYWCSEYRFNIAQVKTLTCDQALELVMEFFGPRTCRRVLHLPSGLISGIGASILGRGQTTPAPKIA